MYEVMSGDTLSWKVPSPRQSAVESSPESQFTGEGGAIKILKVCFCTNNNLSKNFKLVKCDSSWQIRVRVFFFFYVSEDLNKEGSLGLDEESCQGSRCFFVFEPEIYFIWPL